MDANVSVARIALGEIVHERVDFLRFLASVEALRLCGMSDNLTVRLFLDHRGVAVDRVPGVDRAGSVRESLADGGETFDLCRDLARLAPLADSLPLHSIDCELHLIRLSIASGRSIAARLPLAYTLTRDPLPLFQNQKGS